MSAALHGFGAKHPDRRGRQKTGVFVQRSSRPFRPFATRPEASRRKGKHMRYQDAALELKPRNPCPVCGVETALAEIDRYPLHVNFEIHGYLCEQCGPIKSLVVLRSSRVRKKH